MKESKAAKRRRLENAKKQRIETIRKKHGRDAFIRYGKKAADVITPTRFDSESGRKAALKRHHPEMFDEQKGL